MAELCVIAAAANFVIAIRPLPISAAMMTFLDEAAMTVSLSQHPLPSRPTTFFERLVTAGSRVVLWSMPLVVAFKVTKTFSPIRRDPECIRQVPAVNHLNVPSALDCIFEADQSFTRIVRGVHVVTERTRGILFVDVFLVQILKPVVAKDYVAF